MTAPRAFTNLSVVLFFLSARAHAHIYLYAMSVCAVRAGWESGVREWDAGWSPNKWVG